MKIASNDPTSGAQLGGTSGVIAGAAAAAAVVEHVADTSDAHTATGIAIVDGNTVAYWPMLALSSGLAVGGNYYGATNVEGALAEIGAALQTLTGTVPRYWPMLALSSAASGGVGPHLTDPTDAHDASAVSLLDAGGYYVATDVEGALAEIMTDPTRVWMPLTTVSAYGTAQTYWPMLALSSGPSSGGGQPELVWDANDSLIPSLVVT